MKRLTVLTTTAALVLAGLGAVPAAAATAAPAAARTVTVKGHLRTPTGKAVAGIKVVVRASGAQGRSFAVGSDRSSASGRYELRLPVADAASLDHYELQVRDTGDADGDDGDGRWAPVYRTFRSAARTVVVDQVLHHGAVVTGRVVSGTGKPAGAGLQVFARDPSGDRARDTTSTLTRSDGTYRFGNLPAERLVVGFDPPSANASLRYFTTGSAGGTTDTRAASALRLAYGTTTAKVSVRFPPVGRITGRVTVDGVEPFGESEDYVDVVLLDSKGVAVSRFPSKPTFHFRDVDPGTYYLRVPGGQGVVPEYYADSMGLDGAVPIVVRPNGSVTRLVVAVASDSPAQ